jgi:DNA-binding NtrC family response regulator
MSKSKILVADDDEIILFAIRDFLEQYGYVVDEAQTCAEAGIKYRTDIYDLVILDYSLPDGNGLELLLQLKEIDSRVPVIMLTGFASIELAVKAIQQGAEQFLTKPLDLPAMLIVIERTIENDRNRRRMMVNTSRSRPEKEINPFIGTSSIIRNLEEQVRLIAGTDSPIIILGETGTGKSELARWIHRHSARANEPMLELNCGGFTREFLETELFGHEKGAFTGAINTKIGLLEAAHRGTVFLDEIGDMDLQIQPKLLKVLEEKRFRRLGEVQDRKVDFRLVAATHQNIEKLIQEMAFRLDLYYRISAIKVLVPPLRDRTEDIPSFAQAILDGLTNECGRDLMNLTESAEHKMQRYSWPGNIREMRNVLERAIIGAKSLGINDTDIELPGNQQNEDKASSAHLTLEELERNYIRQILNEEDGHVDRAAKRLNIPRSTLYQKIKAFGSTISRI